MADDDEWGDKCLSFYNSVRSVFADLRATEETAAEPFPLSHQRTCMRKWARRRRIYTRENLRDKWPAMEWLVHNLCKKRHLK